jgi:hypothetical protein
MRISIHNISDRPNTPGGPVSINLGGVKLRPGQCVLVDDSVLNQKHRDLHGTRLWFGELPDRFVRTSRAALRLAREDAAPSNALDLVGARAYLEGCSLEDLLTMAQACSPPVDLRPGLTKAAALSRLSRALFQAERELDPETFFWLGRWTSTRSGFIPRE